jgi:hypothetical protein
VLRPARLVLKGLLYFTFGQALSLILVDVGLPGFHLLFADILGTILVFLIALTAVRERKIDHYLLLIFLFGLLHGLSYARELATLSLPLDQKLPALFMFNIAIDVCQYAAAGFLLLFVKILEKMIHWKIAVSYAAGILSVALLIALFQEHVVTGKRSSRFWRGPILSPSGRPE